MIKKNASCHAGARCSLSYFVFIAGHSARSEDDLAQSNSHFVVIVICFTLLMLLLGNAILFYKLWQLEDFNLKTQVDRRFVLARLFTALRNIFSSPMIIYLVKLYHIVFRSLDSGAMHYAPVPVDRHREAVERWQQIVGKSLQLVDELRTSLVHLQAQGAHELNRLARQD